MDAPELFCSIAHNVNLPAFLSRRGRALFVPASREERSGRLWTGLASVCLFFGADRKKGLAVRSWPDPFGSVRVRHASCRLPGSTAPCSPNPLAGHVRRNARPTVYINDAPVPANVRAGVRAHVWAHVRAGTKKGPARPHEEWGWVRGLFFVRKCCPAGRRFGVHGFWLPDQLRGRRTTSRASRKSKSVLSWVAHRTVTPLFRQARTEA